MLSATLADMGVAHGGSGTCGPYGTENWYAVPQNGKAFTAKRKAHKVFFRLWYAHL